MDQTPFTGVYINNEGKHIRLLTGKELTLNQVPKDITPFYGVFSDIDGTVHNLSEISSINPGGTGEPSGNYLPLETKIDSQWDEWRTGTMFSFGFPNKNIPKIYNFLNGGALYNDGMYVSQCGNNSRWNQNNFPNGGHVFEGWSKDRKYRWTGLVLERNSTTITGGGNSDFTADGLARAAIQVFDYGTETFGWMKVGSDSKYDYKGGWDFTDTWAKAHTPLTFRAQEEPTKMPGKSGSASIPVKNGTVYYGKDGNLHLYTNGQWFKIALLPEGDMEPPDPSLPTVDKPSVIDIPSNISPSSITYNTFTEQFVLSDETITEFTFSVNDISYRSVKIVDAWEFTMEIMTTLTGTPNTITPSTVSWSINKFIIYDLTLTSFTFNVDDASYTATLKSNGWNIKDDSTPTEYILITEHSNDGMGLSSSTGTLGQPLSSNYAYGHTDYIPAEIGDTITVSSFLANNSAAATIWCYSDDDVCIARITSGTDNAVAISAGVIYGANTAYYDFEYTLPDVPVLQLCKKIRVVVHKYPWISMTTHPFYVRVDYTY